MVTLSSMLLTRQKRPKPLSKQKKEGFRRNPRKGPPLGNPYIYWKNQPFSLDIKAITSQWHECSGMMLLYMETSRSMVVVHGNRSVEGVMIVAFRELEHFLIIALIVLPSITWFKLMESATYAWALYSGKVLFSYR